MIQNSLLNVMSHLLTMVIIDLELVHTGDFSFLY